MVPEKNMSSIFLNRIWDLERKQKEETQRKDDLLFCFIFSTLFFIVVFTV